MSSPVILGNQRQSWRLAGSPIRSLFFIYRSERGISTHGSEMYLGPCALGSSNWKSITEGLAWDQRAAEGNRRDVDPAACVFFAHKSQFFQQDATASGIAIPAFAGKLEGILRGLLCAHLHKSDVGNVGPFFAESEDACIQPVVQIAH